MLVTFLLVTTATTFVACAVYRVIAACVDPTPRPEQTRQVSSLPLTQRPLPHRENVGIDDINTALAGHLSAADARLVLDKARDLGIKPLTMWTAIRAYGARKVAVAVAADVSHEALLEHLASGRAPKFGELSVFAAINGLEAAAAAGTSGQAMTGQALAPRDRSQIERQLFAGLDIYEPGVWPAGPQAA